MLRSIVIGILFSVSFTSQADEQLKGDVDLQELFEQFIIEYNRQYKDDNEKALRYSYFVVNVEKADELNKKYKETEFGITKFSDWSDEEIEQLLGAKGELVDSDEGLVPLQKFNHGPAPSSFDWRVHNVVTPVKYQGMCGSCWAFSTVGNIEGQYALKYHKLISFSEQEVVDCSTHNNGCHGGFPYKAFRDLSAGALMEPESVYSYKAKTERCRYNQHKGIARVTGYNFINAKDEEQLKQKLYEHGPLSFIMNAATLNHMKGGLLTECTKTTPTHAMLIVGYGSEAGIDYWIVKNSWGSDWNHGGYFRMKRGINVCDILNVGQIVTAQVA